MRPRDIHQETGRGSRTHAVSARGLRALGLPRRYPLDRHGREIGHDRCRRIGRKVRDSGLRGVWCKSACTSDGRGRELAWFPATSRSKARPVWAKPLPIGSWRYVATWDALGLEEQARLRR